MSAATRVLVGVTVSPLGAEGLAIDFGCKLATSKLNETDDRIVSSQIMFHYCSRDMRTPSQPKDCPKVQSTTGVSRGQGLCAPLAPRIMAKRQRRLGIERFASAESLCNVRRGSHRMGSLKTAGAAGNPSHNFDLRCAFKSCVLPIKPGSSRNSLWCNPGSAASLASHLQRQMYECTLVRRRLANDIS